MSLMTTPYSDFAQMAKDFRLLQYLGSNVHTPTSNWFGLRGQPYIAKNPGFLPISGRKLKDPECQTNLDFTGIVGNMQVLCIVMFLKCRRGPFCPGWSSSNPLQFHEFPNTPNRPTSNFLRIPRNPKITTYVDLMGKSVDP